MNHTDLTERFMSILGDLGQRRIGLDVAERMLDRLAADASDNRLPFVRPSREDLSTRVLKDTADGASGVRREPTPLFQNHVDGMSDESSEPAAPAKAAPATQAIQQDDGESSESEW